MLRFYYDFLLPCVGPENFEMVYMDTDSYYFACSAETLKGAVETDPIRHREFRSQADNFLETPETLKEPGLFKLECRANAIAALNAKCYYAETAEGETDKYSTKGVSHTTNTFTLDEFKKVLDIDDEASGELTVKGTNKGLRRVKGDMLQYELTKTALTHVYVKRKVLSDKISTVPLDL